MKGRTGGKPGAEPRKRACREVLHTPFDPLMPLGVTTTLIGPGNSELP